MRIGALILAGAVAVLAQTTTQVHPGKGGSPHVRSEWTVDGAKISIEYGRPYLKGRPESQVMPPGKPWRTGADEATILTTDKQLKFGALTLAPGSYTLNTQPGEKEWQLIVGKMLLPWFGGAPAVWTTCMLFFQALLLAGYHRPGRHQWRAWRDGRRTLRRAG